MKEEKRRNEKHQKPRQYEQILCVALPPENQPQKSNCAHNAGAHSGRDKARENHVDDNRKDHRSRRNPARQTKEERHPCNDGCKQADMGTGYGENVYDSRSRKCLKQFRTYPFIPAKEHGEDCGSISARHNLCHALEIVGAHLCRPPEKSLRIGRLFIGFNLYAVFARGESCRDALTAQKISRVDLPRILIVCRAANFSLCRDAISNLPDRLLLCRVSPRVNIDFAASRLFLAPLFNPANGSRIAYVLNPVCIRCHSGRIGQNSVDARIFPSHL